MIRKRAPSRDDAAVYRMARELLLPYARQTTPGIPFSMKLLKRRLSRCTTYVYVGASRRTAGFIALRREPSSLMVDMLAVHRLYQGRGIGSQLIRVAERKARRQSGCREIKLWVDEANTAAQRFYVSNGYRSTYYHPQIKCFYMTKPV